MWKYCKTLAKHRKTPAKHHKTPAKHHKNHKTHLLTKQPEFANKPALAQHLVFWPHAGAWSAWVILLPCALSFCGVSCMYEKKKKKTENKVQPQNLNDYSNDFIPCTVLESP